MDLVHPSDRTKTEAAAAAIMAGQATSDFENRYCRRDGSVVHMMWSAIWSAKEETMFCVARDITKRKEAEELIHKQAALLDCAQEAIFVQDIKGSVLFWNKSAAQIYGCSAEEVIGQPFILVAGSSREQHAEAWRTVLEKGDWSGEFTERARNGREFMVEGHWTLVRDFAGAPESVLCINTDITERKKLEKQFLRAQRMESIGTLAGGIAHDLNNVLSPIVMSIELLKLNSSDVSTLDVLETIEMNARRGADMVRQVLSFARGVEGQRLLVQPKYLLTDVLKIASDTFPRNIELEAAIPPDLWNVRGDATQLHQVLLNLCVNARDAMPGGGRITIAAANVVLDEHYVAMNAEAQVGPHVVLQIQDNGTGMTAEIRDKIFDPFFTTKEIGKGTGLGLSTSLAIVKSHGGFVRVYTEVGRGTSFKVHLPAENGQSVHVQEAAPVSLPRGNGELIMVIDDEFSIRAITQQTLDAFGYRCLMAADGAEAVALYAKNQAEVAVVVTDMMMPMMDGPATIQILRKLNPKLPIIAASGLSASSQIAKVTSLEVKRFLAKPYTAETLLTALNEILSGEA
jgi:PAS domain S-box-containing protein